MIYRWNIQGSRTSSVDVKRIYKSSVLVYMVVQIKYVIDRNNIRYLLSYWPALVKYSHPIGFTQGIKIFFKLESVHTSRSYTFDQGNPLNFFNIQVQCTRIFIIYPKEFSTMYVTYRNPSGCLYFL